PGGPDAAGDPAIAAARRDDGRRADRARQQPRQQAVDVAPLRRPQGGRPGHVAPPGAANLLRAEYHGRRGRAHHHLGPVLRRPTPRGAQPMTRWLYLSIALTLLAFGASLYLYEFRYDDLPERVPIHWDINFNPDGWAPKQDAVTAFFLLPLAMAGVCLLT